MFNIIIASIVYLVRFFADGTVLIDGVPVATVAKVGKVWTVTGNPTHTDIDAGIFTAPTRKAAAAAYAKAYIPIMRGEIQKYLKTPYLTRCHDSFQSCEFDPMVP